MNRSIFLTAVILGAFAAKPVFAGPLREAAGVVGDAVGYVGETVGDTAGAVGNSVKSAAKTITGNDNPYETRSEIDTVEKTTVKSILSSSKSADALFRASYGYAVFDSRKSSFLITTGKGIGVAVRKESGDRTYMHVATLGANFGAGMKFYQGLFLFETKAAFDAFVDRGWQADAGVSATLGKASLEADAKFTNGMAYYQISETGILLDASLSGTKYWKSKELNSLG